MIEINELAIDHEDRVLKILEPLEGNTFKFPAKIMGLGLTSKNTYSVFVSYNKDSNKYETGVYKSGKLIPKKFEIKTYPRIYSGFFKVICRLWDKLFNRIQTVYVENNNPVLEVLSKYENLLLEYVQTKKVDTYSLLVLRVAVDLTLNTSGVYGYNYKFLDDENSIFNTASTEELIEFSKELDIKLVSELFNRNFRTHNELMSFINGMTTSKEYPKKSNLGSRTEIKGVILRNSNNSEAFVHLCI